MALRKKWLAAAGRFALRVSAQLVVILIIYVLSIGPMFWRWYEATYMGGSPFVAQLYYPLARACDNETVRGLVNGYIELWIL